MTATVEQPSGKGAELRRLRYHLRFQITPGGDVEARARDLADFCRRHGIEEVVLFFAAEDWNNGLLSKREEDLWFRTVKRTKAVLDQAGLVVSLNPWMTVLHCSRGRRFPRDRRFEPAVSPCGEISRACGSFGDPVWRDYVVRLYRRFAKLGFRIVWIEDDFRYHNHGPLTWGSGFEDSILRRFSAKVGRRVTRKTLVRNILRPGRPHPWRALWMGTWREVQLEVARALAEAVGEASGGRATLGLMSSHPATHAVEGRRWRPLFEALSIGGRVAHRPHFAPYGEAPGREKSSTIAMLEIQKAFRPAGCEVAPEIENFPFTRWSKSDSQTWSEMALAMMSGADALLLDLHPMSGNRASDEPEVGEMLDLSRPALEWIAGRMARDAQARGVGIPWKEDAQEHVRTATGRCLGELNATFEGPARFLLPYGVPISAGMREINAVFGSVAWAFSDEEIGHMLAGGLLLDGQAAAILCRRGFGQDIGVKMDRLWDREETSYCVEEVMSSACGVRRGFFLNANMGSAMARIEPAAGAEGWTRILRADRRRFGAGLVTYRNRRGGRVAVYAAPDPAGQARSYQRQTIAQRVVDFLAGGKFSAAMAIGAPFCMPMHLSRDGRHWVVVFNGHTDPAEPIIHVGELNRKPRAGTLLRPLAPPQPMEMSSWCGTDGCVVMNNAAIPFLGFAVVEW